VQLARLREDHALVERKYNSLKKRGAAGSSEVEEELVMYKKLMQCNSCHLREKNAVLVKCMHVFCRRCLEERIETRQRKCPNCGENFAASDIRTIYL
jgi:E3 ubiquitin-protein ligase BRE1